MSRYDLFRRRIAPIAFGVAIAFMARESCNKQERTHAAVVIDYGEAEPRVKAIDIDVWSDGDRLATFHRIALPGRHIGKTTFDGLLSAKDGELRFDVDLGDSHRTFSRRFHTEEGATITVPIESELR